MKFDSYSCTFIHFYEDDVPELLIKYLPNNNFSIADLGAGDGVLIVAMQRRGYLRKANQILAVDISKDRCDRLGQCNDIKVICSDVTDIPVLGDNTFDYIINTQVIEHVNENKLLSEIKRILRYGGILYIASLVSEKGNDKHYMLKYGWRYGWRFYKQKSGKWFLDPTHLREYESEEHFVKVIKSAGFDIIEARLTPLRLSILEFIVRRLIIPIFNPQSMNSFFFRHRYLDLVRKKIKIQPPGYFLIEVIATKNMQG